jgi:hypothetical protein
MKRYFILNLIFFFILQIAVLKAQTESYDAEYLKLVKEYTLNPDGSYDFHYHKEIKLLTYFSFHRLFGETFIVYNPEYQELKINESFTVMADGEKIVAPANAFNEVLPGFARDIPACNHLREMVVTHTATEVGCVITLDYTIKTKAGFLPFFFGSEDIEDIVPIKSLSLVVKIPSAASLQFRVHNFCEDPDLNGFRGGLNNHEESGQKIYMWDFRNVPALSHSPNQDPEQKVCLLFSTSKDMMYAYFAFVNQDAFKAEPGAEISKRVDAAIKDKKSDLDKILALQEVVIDELKLADIPLIYTGYKVRTPAAVWQSANATSLEKAILLAEMLKLANINACPVATMPNGWFDRDMGNPAVFDGFIVQVNPKETGRIYLSVNQKQSQNLIFDVQDKTMIQLDGSIEAMRTFKEKSNPNVLEMEAKLRLGDRETGRPGDKETGRQGEDKTVGGELEVEMSGIVNPYYKLRKDSSYVKTMLAGDFPSSSIINIKEEQLAELKSRYLITKNQEPGTNYYNGFIYFELPRFKTGFDAWNLVQFTGSGDTPVRLDFPLKEEYSYSVSLPSDYVLFTPPVDLNIKNDLGELKISIAQSGSTVKIERSFEFYKDVISSDKMKEFKEMVLAWEKIDYRKIVLKNNP